MLLRFYICVFIPTLFCLGHVNTNNIAVDFCGMTSILFLIYIIIFLVSVMFILHYYFFVALAFCDETHLVDE
jgi:hypothetical protein